MWSRKVTARDRRIRAAVQGLLPLAREQRTSPPSSPSSPTVSEASRVRLLPSGEVLRHDSRAREWPPVRGGRGGTHAPQRPPAGREAVLGRGFPTISPP